ncbi:MAG: antitoxin family protein [Candidatus Aenigmatarchaeota archaeon]
MAKVIEAIYENGVFKPLEKVDLKEGERVKIEIKEKRLVKNFIIY